MDPGVGDDSEPKVSLLGYNATGILLCQWQSSTTVRTLAIAKQELPQAVEVAKPVIAPKRRVADNGTAASAGP